MNIIQHPAPGLGEMIPGWYAVPQNPVQPVTYQPTLGEIMPGSFPVPQNPVRDFAKGNTRMIGQQTGTGYGVCGCGGSCGGCSGKLNGRGVGDLASDWATVSGDLTAGNFMAAIQDTVFGVPVWAIGAGLALLLFSGGSQSHYRRGRRAIAAY